MHCAAAGRPNHDHAAWALLALVVVLIGALELRRPLAIDIPSLSSFTIACLPLVGAAFFYGRVRRNERFAVMCLTLLQVLLFSALGEILSYLIAREGGPMWDAHFTSWDRAVGLDWLAFVRAMDRQPALTAPLYWAYVSLIPQVVVVVLLLGFIERLRQLRVFMLAAMLCGGTTILLSPLVPSVSSYVYLGLTQAQFHHIDISPGYTQFADLQALRSGTFKQIVVPELQGIIAFPSYHAGLASIILWGFWTSGSRYLRWPGTIAAAAIIISAPIHGGHYFVDIFAGVAIAVASIAAAKRLTTWDARALLPSRPVLASPEPLAG
jgi:hypothetical protein